MTMKLSRAVTLRLGVVAVVLTGLVMCWTAMLVLSWFNIPGLSGRLDEVVVLADIVTPRHFTVLTHSYLEVGGMALLTGLSVAALGMCARGFPPAQLVVAGLAGVFTALLLLPGTTLLISLSESDTAVTMTGLLWLLVGCGLAAATAVTMFQAGRRSIAQSAPEQPALDPEPASEAEPEPSPTASPAATSTSVERWLGWVVLGMLHAAALIHILVVLDFFTAELPAALGAWLPVPGYLVAGAGVAGARWLPAVEFQRSAAARDEVGLSVLDDPDAVVWQEEADDLTVQELDESEATDQEADAHSDRKARGAEEAADSKSDDSQPNDTEADAADGDAAPTPEPAAAQEAETGASEAARVTVSHDNEATV